jgi:hypothetical protein
MDMEKCRQCGGSLEACSCRRQACLESAEGELLVFLDGHDDAILGLAELDGEPRVVYDRGAIIRKLMRRDGMDEEGAAEFFDYNIACCHAGACAPCFVAPMLKNGC